MSDIAVAMVALSSPGGLDPAEIQRELSTRFGLTKLPVSCEGGVVSVEIGDAFIAMVEVDAAIPWDDLEGPCACSWMWPEATEVMSVHTAHVLVTAMRSQSSILDTFRDLTRVAAAVVATTPAVGVYWGSGTNVARSDMFVGMAQEMDDEMLPLYLWIEFRIQREESGRMSVLTTGLEALGHMEIEIIDTDAEPMDLAETAFNIAHYLLDHGAILKDGDTIGMSEEEKIKIRHLPSVWDRGTVLRLERVLGS